jgi:hypothetical protein
MHPLEGVIIMAAGFIPFSIAMGFFPSDPEKQRELAVRLPYTKNRSLMYCMAAGLWLFGASVLLGLVR